MGCEVNSEKNMSMSIVKGTEGRKGERREPAPQGGFSGQGQPVGDIEIII